jgi:GTPase
MKVLSEEIVLDHATLNKSYPEVEYTNNITREDNNINLVIIGHVDSGKSTLTGHLLYKLGEVSNQALRKHEKKTEEFGKAGF